MVRARPVMRVRTIVGAIPCACPGRAGIIPDNCPGAVLYALYDYLQGR